MVIICGSANSWILDKLINNHGGLYNRVTYEIKLSPFSLCECKEFFDSNDIKFSDYDIVQSFMIFGGIPFYIGYFEKGLSLAQNVDKILFSKSAKLRNEYDRLFESIFSNPAAIKNIVELLSTKNSGFTRKEITENLKITDGGNLSKNLNALLASDFIAEYVPFSFGMREIHYKLTDSFCMFYLKFMNKKNLEENFWQQNVDSQSIISWKGFAFENVCFNHIKQIKNALGIIGVNTKHSAWSKRSDDTDGLQIDLIIERNDNIVNMCEMKFYNDEFLVNKDYYRILSNRQNILSEKLSPKLSIHNTLVTTFGLKYNEYSGIFSKVITLNDLFKDF